MKFTLCFHFINTESIGLQVLLDHLKSPPYLSFRLYEHIHLATVAAASPFLFDNSFFGVQALYHSVKTFILEISLFWDTSWIWDFVLDLMS